MLMLKNKRIDNPLSPSELFSNMTGGSAFRIIETYKSIRTSLMFTLSGGGDNAILITSAEPNSGKSVTSANLSLSFAQSGAKVLLIDCDMRNPSQQKIFAKDNTDGLSGVLAGMVKLDDVVKHGVEENLDLLTAGKTPPNPSELLGSPSMKRLLDVVKTQYDFVFLDCPPIEIVSDTLSLLLHVPQAVVIARQNHAVYNEVIHTIYAIKGVGGKILGAILTDVRESDKSYSYVAGSYAGNGRYGRSRYGKYSRRYGNYYGYGYGYGYGHSHASKKKAERVEPKKETK